MLTAGKTLRQVAGVGKTIDAPFTGYEMHVGQTTRRGDGHPHASDSLNIFTAMSTARSATVGMSLRPY